jgi:ABC-2 type transport system permease protein
MSSVNIRKPSVLKVGVARGGIEIKMFLRQRESVVFTLFFPVLLLFIFGSVFKNNIAPGVSFSQYFVAGMVASGLVNTGFQQLAIMIPIERDFGALKRLRGTPMSPISYFIGKAIVVTAAMLFQVAILVAMGRLFFGLHLPTTADRWIRFGWLIVLGSICSTVLGIAFSSIPKTGRGASAVVSPIVIVLQFLSGVFFVFSSLPTWMQQFAALFPLKWLTQGMRSVFLPDAFAAKEPGHSWEIPKIALILLVWTVIGTVWARRSFKWSDK